MTSSNLILNRVFSKNTLKALLDGDKNAGNAYYAVIKRYLISSLNKKNKDLISEIYKILKHTYRNEYYYKNTLLNNLLFKFHNPLKTTALTEIPVSKSIADFILLNGKATVYEIKTELDTFDRLNSQLINYYKAFDNVCVVVPEIKLETIKNKLKNHNVGIYYISKRGALKKYREPISYIAELDYDTIFKILRKYEYENIISKYYVLPDVSQFKYYQACKELFKTIPLDKVYSDFKVQLKQRTKINLELIQNVPKEIKSVVYFSKLKETEYKTLETFLERKFGG